MDRRTLFAAIVLIALGMVMGIVLVSHLGSGNAIGSVLAQSRTRVSQQLGAKQSPIQLSESVRQLNRVFVEVANAVTPAVVGIRVLRERGGREDILEFFGPFRRFFEERRPEDAPPPQRAQGSGVVVTEDGYIVTNNHVVESVKDEDIRVVTHEGKEFRARVIGRDPLTDLALLKVEARELKPAYFGSMDDIQVGEWVVAVGNPFGLRSTVTAGIISAIGRGGLGVIGGDPYAVENFIQTDAAINPGNSGGGLFTLQGALIGINTAIATTTGFYQGYGFAVPIDIVRSVVEDLMEDGKIDRGYIGVQIQPVDDVTAKAIGLDRPQGAIVSSVLKGGAAERAGIKEGDVILEFDGIPVKSPNHLQGLVVTRRAGQTIRLTIWRDGKRMDKNVTLRRRDEDATVERVSDSRDSGEQREEISSVDLGKLGLSIGPLSERLRTQMEVEEGVEVTRVTPYSHAWERGLRRGDVITHVGNVPVRSTSEFRRLLGQRKPGEAVLLRVVSVGPNGEILRRLVSLEIPS
ncbi:MAG: Do family serine endopeptidase [Candidatus Kapabacteria bacterium]|nr:Do family serine endopeptidase [Candidatus Kapabacteria bacterium]MDW8224914.1 Do family serine endopeptidase [Bacteroidota bacterium]